MKKKADWCAACVTLMLSIGTGFVLYGLAYYGAMTPSLLIQPEGGGPALVRMPDYRYAPKISQTLFSPMYWIDRTVARPELWKSIPLYDPNQLTVPPPEWFEGRLSER